MQRTFSKENWKIGFSGKYAAAGFPALVENGGIRTVGGYLSASNAKGATECDGLNGEKYRANAPVFGNAIFAAPSKPSEFFIGDGGTGNAINVYKAQPADTAVTAADLMFRGFLLNRAMVNEQMPAHSNELINLEPCDAVYQGAIWLHLHAGTALSVKIGNSIYVKADGTVWADGAVNATTNTALATADKTVYCLPNAKVIEKHTTIEGLYLVMLS